MTEENNTPAAAGAAEATGPQLSLQRFYLKDCSFESPNPIRDFPGHGGLEAPDDPEPHQQQQRSWATMPERSCSRSRYK